MILNLDIQNPTFTGDFYNYQNVPELRVGRGWVPWWKQGTPEQTGDGFFRRPEFKPEPNRVLIGNFAQKFFTTFSTHDAGLWQNITVPARGILTLSAQVQLWSLHTDESNGGYACCVGIDPTGSADFEGAVWGEWHGVYDPDGWDGSSWRRVEVSVPVEAGVVTIFLRGACLYRAKHNDSYWDDVRAELAVDMETSMVIERLRNVIAELGDIVTTLEHR